MGWLVVQLVFSSESTEHPDKYISDPAFDMYLHM